MKQLKLDYTSYNQNSPHKDPNIRFTTEFIERISLEQYLGKKRKNSSWGRFYLQNIKNHQYPINYINAAAEAVSKMQKKSFKPLSFPKKIQTLYDIGDKHNVRDQWILNLLTPGLDHPWSMRRGWSVELFKKNLWSLLISFDSNASFNISEMDINNLIEYPSVDVFLSLLSLSVSKDAYLSRVVENTKNTINTIINDKHDFIVIEPHKLVDCILEGIEDSGNIKDRTLRLREAIALIESLKIMKEAEGFIKQAEDILNNNPTTEAAKGAIEQLSLAAYRYRRLAVAQKYAEPIVERHQHIYRLIEKNREIYNIADDRPEHLLLIPTNDSPWDLQRLLLSVSHEIQFYGYKKKINLIVRDSSKKPNFKKINKKIVEQFINLGMEISFWDTERENRFLDDLNREIFKNNEFDIHKIAGQSTSVKKGIHYGRFRNMMILMALSEIKEKGLNNPIITWLDQDNEISALVLTKDVRLDKRHVYNYFEQKNKVFEDPFVLLGGGGYTNDGLEGVDRFWVAWGLLYSIFENAKNNSPLQAPILPNEIDVRKYRPWDQGEILPRLLKENEKVETFADQFLILLRTLRGCFFGKFDNQLQVYHPWLEDAPNIAEGTEELRESKRAFGSMPGGNISARTETLLSHVPYFSGVGRGEDLFYAWLVQGFYGKKGNRTYLTHTPALHTRNIQGGRGDILNEIVNSYNGRLIRESAALWASVDRLMGKTHTSEELVRQYTEEHKNSMWNEAKGKIEEAVNFARAFEPYLYDKNLWWVRRAEADKAYGKEIETLKGLSNRFVNLSREDIEGIVKEKLMNTEEILSEAKEFETAFPFWKQIIDFFAISGAPLEAHATGWKPSETGMGYTYSRQGLPAEKTKKRKKRAALPSSKALYDFDIDEGEWILNTLLATYRKWEQGNVDNDRLLTTKKRIDKLSEIYKSSIIKFDEKKYPWIWTRLFQEALFLPYTSSYNAIDEIVNFKKEKGTNEPFSIEIIKDIADRYNVSSDMLKVGAFLG